MKYNPNKTVSAHVHGINILYTDTCKSHSVSYDEKSPLKQVQVTGHSDEHFKENRFQKILYNHAMYGLKCYTPEQIKAMTYVQKMAITDVYEQAQFKLNMWKLQLIHEKIGSFLTTLFHRSEFARQMATYPKKVSSWEKTTITFRQLGIRRKQIIQKLIEWEILPVQYYELNHG